MNMLGLPVTTVTLTLAAVGAAAVLLWWSARLAIRLATAAAILLGAAAVIYLATGQGPAEWWPMLRHMIEQLGAYIAGAVAGLRG